MGRRVLQVSAGVVLGLAVVLIAVPLLTRQEGATDPHILPAPYPAPSLRLTDQEGELRRIPGDFDGLTAVFFGYTHCPDVCPVTMASLAAVRNRLEPDMARRLQVVLVTVDPARDTPERMGAYLARFDTTFIGLTGTEEEIREAAAAWGAWAERAATPPVTDETGDTAAAAGGEESGREPGAEGYVVDHTARTFVVGPRRRIVATFPASTAPDVMLATVRTLLDRAR